MKKLSYKIRLTSAIIIFILSVLAFAFKFYPVHFFDLQFSALAQRVFCDFSVIAVVFLSMLTVITFLFGRIYCSLLCPFEILQELFAFVFRKKTEKTVKLPLKYFIAALTFGCLAGGSAILLRYTEPYSVFGSAITLSVFGMIFTVLVLVLVFLKNRFFCTNICPVGAVLGLISKVSFCKIYISKDKCASCGMCERKCPSACIDSKNQTVDNENCVKCLKCLDSCSKQAVNYGKEPEKSVQFNIKRRETVTLLSVLAIFGAAYAGGVQFTKNIAKKLKDVILPPGAVNENRILNKCLNCNLCVSNCPNGIIQKADSIFPVVRIDYNKGKKYCKYDCNKCSEVCPSGAIKRISAEEKQKTRIAMASINNDKCQKCEKCVKFCPTGAISVNDNQIVVIDGSKCIGCGRCKADCNYGAIEMYAVSEQQNII